jgi:hypothetical protein
MVVEYAFGNYRHFVYGVSIGMLRNMWWFVIAPLS